MTTNAFDGLSDDTLLKMLDYAMAQRKEHEKAADKFADDVNALRAEQKRRDIEYWWQNHSHLTPVKVGDELLFTDETTAHFESILFFEYDTHQTGITKVCRMSLFNEHMSIDIMLNNGARGGLPVQLVSNMRKAYLASIGGAS